MATQKLKEFSYLAIIPRGLQNEISSGLKKQATALAASCASDSSYSGRTKNVDGDVLSVFTWNEKEEEETMREALREFSKQKKEKEERQKLKAKSSIARHKLKEPPHLSEWLPPECSVGSVKLSSSQQHVSIGYFQKDEFRDDDDKKDDDGFVPCISCTGQLAGSAWMQLETDRRDVSLRVLAPSRMLGPLLALVSVQTDNYCLEASTTKENASPVDHYQRYHQHSLGEMTKEFARHIESNPTVFSERVDRALQVWSDCVEATWKDRLSPLEYTGLQNRIKENRLRFRISCVRVEPAIVPSSFSRKRKKKFNTNTELFAYSRQELCLALMDACGLKLVPGFYDSGSWSVNLKKFDIEMVIFITPPDLRSKNGKLAFGISLCPYSFLQSKSFETGNVPPDVTAPYLGKDVLSKGIVRLRPTTAQLLLQIANLQKYDIVLDPCAGVGTIPVESEQYHKRSEFTHPQGLNESKHFISIGGDLVLNNPKYTQVAGLLENFYGRKNDGLKSSSLLVAWDATHLPMRTSSVDVVVSDLPFGQQCLSVAALQQLLPLVFLECARVLTPTTGRMVILAGGSPLTVIAMIRELSGKYWKKPISRVSPVSIGGILAWILRVDRNDETFDRDSVSSQLDRVRKITQKRDRINRQRKSDSGEQLTGKRKKRNK